MLRNSFADALACSVLSKFTVATDGVQALSIQSAHLLSAGRFDSEACGRDQGVLVNSTRHSRMFIIMLKDFTAQSIMPLQVSNFLFRVTACADKAAQKSECPRTTVRFATSDMRIVHKGALRFELIYSTTEDRGLME